MQPKSVQLSFHSRLQAPAEDVWKHSTNFDLLNREFAPWLKMTSPNSSLLEVPQGSQLPVQLFRSYILLFGILPVEYDDIGLEAWQEGRWFQEDSTMLSMKVWRHRREILPQGEGSCRIQDDLEFVPRIGVLGPAARLAAGLVFSHRHNRLRTIFG
jgi:ligand-binding SRPBCC domain-containing protein